MLTSTEPELVIEPDQSYPPAPIEHRLLERVGLALNSTLELSEVLKQLAGLSLEVSGADRCSIFLLDGTTLNPAAAIGDLSDEELWCAFRAMGPIELESIPGGWELLMGQRAVAVSDALNSALIPDQWVERFCLRSLVLVPLIAAGEPCGLMAVDYRSPRSFDPSEIKLLESIGSYAGVAVRNAHLFEMTRRRSELQEGLVRASAALASPTSRHDLLARLVDFYIEIFGARLCVIGLLDAARDRVRIMAAGGPKTFEDSVAIHLIPERIVDTLRKAWAEGVSLESEDDPWLADFVGGRRAGASRYLLIPLLVDDVRGGVLLGFAAHVRLDPEERAAAEALAAIASASLERTLLVDRLGRQLRRSEILHALGDALAEHADADGLTARLNELLADQRIEITGLVFRDRLLTRVLGGAAPTAKEKEAWRSRKPSTHLEDGTLSVTMRLGKRLVGSIRVRPADLEPEELSFVEALAHGVAEVASRGALRAAVEEAERERAVGAERGRIAADLHDTAGQIFVAIGLLARRDSEHVPGDSPWRSRLQRLAELADTGKWEISRAIQALAFFPEASRGVAPSVRALARSFEMDSGIDTIVDVEGGSYRLAPRAERALYRVAHEALTNAWRHARCASVRLELAFKETEVSLRVVDDGVGLRRLASVAGVGVSGMRRSVDEVGGSLRIRPIKPHGTCVEARVAKDVR